MSHADRRYRAARLARREKHHRRIATERTRRYRERRDKGYVIASVPVSHEIIGFLLDTRWLAEADSESRNQIGLAIAAMLTDAAHGDA